MPGTIDDSKVENTQVQAWAKPNAHPIQKQFPTIIFIPGRGGERQQYTILLEELASQGYVVLAMDQAYVANYVKFSDGRTVVITYQDARKLPIDCDYRYAYDDAVIAGAIGNIQYILDHLNDIEDIKNLCDPHQIILMGHSLGGNVAHNLGFNDSRIKAVVDIDSKITKRKVFGRIGVPTNKTSIPVLFIRGALQYQEDVEDQLTRVNNATIWSPNVQHSAFSDNAYFAAKIENFGNPTFLSKVINWFF